MKGKEILKLGYPQGPTLACARAAAGAARAAGRTKPQVRDDLKRVLADPERFEVDELYGTLARGLIEAGVARRSGAARSTEVSDYQRPQPMDYAVWGEQIDPQAHQQMGNACRLPISVAAALMPDAHVGYGLPIGGVLATDNAVIPYAVGVDIACRMMMTVFALPAVKLADELHRFREILETNTRFGIGAEWKPRRDHPVMDEDWAITPVTARLKDLAYRQLGTSGSGNHFVEFGKLDVFAPMSTSKNSESIPAGGYVAVMSHSGSRGPGNKVATHYSQWAMSQHEKMPKELRHLAWLDLDGDGAEYWAAMELMGRYASANHHIIHRQIVEAVGLPPVFQVENHHNFAWKQEHQGRTVIVHRKGATPAGKGDLGIIPGSMASPGYLVEGLGHPLALRSAAHGAGRVMSRRQAKRVFNWHDVSRLLADRGVTLLSAGLDEVPEVYKDIDQVMAAQADLVTPRARFTPRIVKMAPPGQRAED